MIWRWNMPQRKTDSITVTGNLMAVRNFNEIVRPVIMPLLRQQRADVLLQSNVRPQTTHHKSCSQSEQHWYTRLAG